MISIYSRQCTYSKVSANKQRPEWFSREKCFDNLVKNFHDFDTRFKIVYDGKIAKDSYLNRYLEDKRTYPNMSHEEIQAGSEGSSFQALLNIIMKDNLPDDEIVYIVEDDYLHKDGSIKVLRDAFRLHAIDYVSLYDHPDKYDPNYLSLHHIDPFMTRLYHGQHCHYRAAISTTNTYAMRMSTLKRDFKIHMEYSNYPVTQDHMKFLHLVSSGKRLITAVPSYAAHIQSDVLPPLFKKEDYEDK